MVTPSGGPVGSVDAALRRLLAGVAEVVALDVAETEMDLQLQELAYRAALSATARVLQPSLLDFLR